LCLGGRRNQKSDMHRGESEMGKVVWHYLRLPRRVTSLP
jgi:hypothetical protein